MNMRNLIPWGRGLSQRAPAIYREEDRNPFFTLHREMNRLFDDAFRAFDGGLSDFGFGGAFSTGWPNVEIAETDTAVVVSAEVPGLQEKDVEIVLDNDVLTLRGEKRSEAEDRDKHFSERFYGRFERQIPLGYEVDEDKAEARFRNGVLTITLPKKAEAQSRLKRIAIKS